MAIRMCCALSILFLGAASRAAELPTTQPRPFISPLFGDHMLLQRDKPSTLWGWADPGASICITLRNHIASTTAGGDGRWKASITPPPPGGPYTLRIDGPQSLELRDVLVGDLWLCGGQSNMELPLSRTNNANQEIKAADLPAIRYFKVRSHPSYASADTPSGQWQSCSPNSAGDFSAVAYYFAKHLHADLHIPIGVISDNLGGTPIETWMSPDTLAAFPEFHQKLDFVTQMHQQHVPEYGNFISHWYDLYDQGVPGHWEKSDYDDRQWKRVDIQSAFSDLGLPDTPTLCWFRREVSLPDPLPPGHATLHLGPIERMDTAYLNGQWVGASAWVENPRVYQIPPNILKPGKNLLALRILKTKPAGGFLSPKELRLELADKSAFPLTGQWSAALSVDARPPHPMPLGFENWPTMPGVLYRGMLQPIAPLALTGFLWYQGESNTDRAFQYRSLLPAMIADWRTLFRQGDLPFYIVGLPAFMKYRAEPGTDGWAELREAQLLTAKTTPATFVVTTIDTGDPDDIHPKDKSIVGERLARLALATHYGRPLPAQDATFTSLEVSPDRLTLHFDHTYGKLVAKNGTPLAGCERCSKSGARLGKGPS